MQELEIIRSKIYEIRGQKVMLDRELASMYGVETRALNQAVKRNAERFPEDFMFQLTSTEWDNLKSQFVTSGRETSCLSSSPHRIQINPYPLQHYNPPRLSTMFKCGEACEGRARG